jgi:stigma-specific protein Stig1
MRIRHVVLAIAAGLLIAADESCHSPNPPKTPPGPGSTAVVIPFHPDLTAFDAETGAVLPAWGGRAVAIAVDPDDSKKMFVASAGGGLFHTGDGGSTWSHVDSLPSFSVVDVTYAKGASEKALIVSTAADHHEDYSCVWRSTDDGATWSHPLSGGTPTPGLRCPDLPSGHGLWFQPNSEIIYVGTDCGVLMSEDLGQNFELQLPVKNAAPSPDKLQSAVWSVLAQSTGQVNIAAQAGLFHRTGNHGTWSKAKSTDPSGNGARADERDRHAFAASPYHPDHLLQVGLRSAQKTQLWMSTDAGDTWAAVPNAPEVLHDEDNNTIQNQPLFLRATRKDPAQNTLDAYFSDGKDLYRWTFSDKTAFEPSGAYARYGTPQIPNEGCPLPPETLDHGDPFDVAFDSAGIPILLAGDGGVHGTSDQGLTWKATGGGPGGFDALLITSVIGLSIPAPYPHQDLYLASWDTGFFVSHDGGGWWASHHKYEGYGLQAAVTGSLPLDVDVTLTGMQHTDPPFKTHEGFSPWENWASAPGSSSNVDNVESVTPPYLLKTGYYLQGVDWQTIPIGSRPVTMYLTTNTGQSWKPVCSFSYELRGAPAIAGDPADPTIYQAVSTGSTTTNGLEQIGLLKITHLYTTPTASNAGALTDLTTDATCTVSADTSTGFGGLGLSHSHPAVDLVSFGVDPADPQHLIMADVQNERMKSSSDGGKTWTEDSMLTGRVGAGSGGHTSRFRIDEAPSARIIAFDPSNGCHVLVGTAQDGVIRSADGGTTWARVDGSEQLGPISSIYFPSTGDVVVASFGRGMWKLHVDRTQTCTKQASSAVAGRVTTVFDLAKGTRAPLDLGKAICPRCQYLIVRNGAITDVEMQGLGVSRVLHSGGTIHQVDARQGEVPLAIPNGYSRTNRLGERRAFAPAVKEGAPVRGLVLEGNRLRGIISSREPLSFKPARTPYLRVLTSRRNGAITIIGTGFAPRGALKVSVAGEPLPHTLVADASGSFRVQTRLDRPEGEYEVSVEQQEGNRLSLETAHVTLIGDEWGVQFDKNNPCETDKDKTCCVDKCVDLSKNEKNCGECGNECASNEKCKDGKCKCDADVMTDRSNCGECNHACGLNESCKEGVCKCNFDMLTDPNNCGSCGHVCTGYKDTCVNGSCCAQCVCNDRRTFPGVCNPNSCLYKCGDDAHK